MKYFLFWLILFPFLSLKAQEVVKPDWHITPKLHYGFIWNFDDEVAHLANQHYTAYELSITKQTKGNKEWQNAYRLPQVGYSLYYFSFDRTKPVGNIAAVLIHAGKNIYKTKRSNLQWRIGFGTAYTERRFDYQNNFKNNVVSQRINFGLNGQLNFNCHITQKVFLHLGLELMHFSNGALKRPNFGVNLPAAHVGIGLKLIGSESLTKKDTASFFKRKTSVHLSSFWGYKEVYPVNGPKYLLGGLNAIIEQRINRKSGLHAGLDFSYDHSKKSEIDYDAIPVENNFYNRGQASILLGHEMYMNKLSLLTQAGIYVIDPTKINKAMYQKVGLKYYLSEKIFTSMTMKIHLGVADWIEWAMGVKL